MKPLSRTYEFHSTRVENSYGSSIPKNRTKLGFRHSYLLFSLVLLLVMFAETLSYSAIGIAYSYFQAFLVIFHLLRGKLFQAMLLHLLFILTSLEWPADLALRPVIYSYRTVSILGVSISTIVLGLLFVVTISKRGFHFRVRKEQMWFLLLFFLAILTGFFGLLFSDYGLSYFISDLQYWTVLIMSTGLGFAFFSANRPAFSKFENVLLFVLCSRSVVSFFGSLLGFQKGSYGGISIFSYDAIDILIPLIVFALFEQIGVVYKTLLLTSWLIGLLNILRFSASGKELLLIVGVLSMLVVKLLSKGISRVSRIMGFALLTVGIVLSVMFLPSVMETNILFSSKFIQARSLVSLSWIENPYILPSSPRDRVLELYNTAAYYSENPTFLLAGRGFGGYFEDKTFYNYSASDRGGYSTEEVKTRKFVNPHESLNVIFLKFGLAGVVVWIMFLLKFLKTAGSFPENGILLRSSGFVLVLLFLGFSLKLASATGFCVAAVLRRGNNND